jgi:methyl-accepting chemotaxis protein
VNALERTPAQSELGGAAKTAIGGLAPRILLSLGILGLLIVIVALSGRVALRHVMDQTQDILIRDVHVSEEALQAHTAALQLRRYEKDFFLNIGSADTQREYMDKWNVAHADVLARIDALDGLVSSSDDHATLRDMRAKLGEYDAGFQLISSGVKSGQITTPRAANLAIVPYKPAMRSFEELAEAIGGASKNKMAARITLLRTESSRSARDMNLVALLALIFAVAVGLRVRAALRTSN